MRRIDLELTLLSSIFAVCALISSCTDASMDEAQGSAFVGATAGRSQRRHACTGWSRGTVDCWLEQHAGRASGCDRRLRRSQRQPQYPESYEA